MLLVVDVGNTQTVIGLLDGGAIVADWRIATVRHRTADEMAGLLQGFFSLLGERLQERRHRGRHGLGRAAPHRALGDMSESTSASTPFVARPRRAHRHAHPAQEPGRGRRRPHRQRRGRPRVATARR